MNTNRITLVKGHASSSPQVGKRVTINDLARHLCMSKSTVSRALNGYSDISDTTRNRVERTAQKLGYRPLSHAQAIRTGRVRAIALVLQIDEPDQHNPFLQEFLAGACQAASEFGWTVTISTAKSDQDMDTELTRLIEERKADGFILPRTKVTDPRVRLLRQLGVPYIMFGRTDHGQKKIEKDASWFDISGETAMHNAVVRLVSLGHQRIGYVGSDPEFNYSHLRREGFTQGLHATELQPDPDLLREGARTRDEGSTETRALLQLDQPPTAIVYATDMAALGAYKAITELGLTVGKDVSVIGYDGVPESQYVRPALTTYDVDTRMAGERLASLLVRQIRGEPADQLRELREAQLVERDSDGPPALSSTDLAEKIQEQ